MEVNLCVEELKYELANRGLPITGTFAILFTKNFILRFRRLIRRLSRNTLVRDFQ